MMSEEFKLVPIQDVSAQHVATDLYECVSEETTRRQLEQYLPSPLDYGESKEHALGRVERSQRLAQANEEFQPYVHVLGEAAIGMAVLDGRVEARKWGKLLKYIGSIATQGPHTSSWIAAPYQGRGYGRASLERRIEMATQEQGKPGLWTVVDSANNVSMRNVEARGFRAGYSGKLWVSGEQFSHATVYQYLAKDSQSTPEQ